MFLCLTFKNSHLMPHYFSKTNSVTQLKVFSRNISLFGKSNPKPLLLDKSQYRVVYDFSHIYIVAGILRTTRWVPASGVAITPILYHLNESIALVLSTLTSAGIYLLLGIAFSRLTRNLVGKMYVKKEGDITDVMISSVDVYGRRVDRIHKLGDIMNIDYSSKFARSLGLVRLGIENSDLFYSVNLRSKIIDEKVFDIILGLVLNMNEMEETPKFKLENPKKEL